MFYYDSNFGSMIGYRGSFGSDVNLNDHHFHYGYFIRAAAEVARVDPQWADQWGGMVKLLIRDIAASSRDDKMFAPPSARSTATPGTAGPPATATPWMAATRNRRPNR